MPATENQRGGAIIEGLNEALHYFGGLPQAIVTDNLKAAVSRASKYAPQINKTLKDLALHYGCVVDPTRPYAPQNKALVENAVTQIYRRVFYPLSKQTFFSRENRRSEFEMLERACLQPLPNKKYEVKFYKALKVQKMGYIYFSADLRLSGMIFLVHLQSSLTNKPRHEESLIASGILQPLQNCNCCKARSL